MPDLDALRRLWDDESGATAVEYALIGAFLTVAILTAFSGGFTDSLANLYQTLADAVVTAADGL